MNPITISTIPMDLLTDEILTKLPAKSVARLSCVSKLFLDRSSARPRLLLALQRPNGEVLFFSCPQPYYGGKSCPVVTADFHMKFCAGDFGCTSSLIYRSDIFVDGKMAPEIYNPLTTRLFAGLPKVKRYRKFFFFLGYDPVGEQFKAVFMAYPNCSDKHKILTIGSGKLKWRNTDCQFGHFPLSEGICIRGVLYFLAEFERTYDDRTYDGKYVIVCLDVRTEEFKLLDADFFPEPETIKLVNCKGKLGGIDLRYDEADAIELYLYVLEDFEEQEWSKYVYTLPKSKVATFSYVSVVGMMSATGEIVLLEKCTLSTPFYVLYFSPERNSLQTVEIQGVGDYGEPFESQCKVYAYVDYVKDFSLQRV